MNENQENLNRQEAVKKLQKLAEGIDVCMFGTNLGEMPIAFCPMSVREVDDNGTVWFLSGDDSVHNNHIRNDRRVQLLFSHPSDYKFLSVFGHAEIHKDRATIDAHWSEIANAWFENGKDDPNVSVVSVRPESSYYWDTKSNKIVSFMKYAFAAVTGGTADEGREGNLNI